MKYYQESYLKEIITKILLSCRVSEEDSKIISEELIEANLMGIDSHGIMRIKQYVEMILSGKVKIGAKIKVIRNTMNTGIIDSNNNFGMISANHIIKLAYKKAEKYNIALVTSINNGHIGRLGSYTQKVAEKNMIALAWASSPKQGHWVVPWGGCEGRIATNPFSYSIPTNSLPIVFDMSTSAISEGAVRLKMYENKSLDQMCIVDNKGNISANPKDLYTKDLKRSGAILPFGGQYGYKGYGLALLGEIMCGILAGKKSSENHSYINNFSILVINQEAFLNIRKFKSLIQDLISYHKSAKTASGFKEIIIPGLYDFKIKQNRQKKGIPINDDVWSIIIETAKILKIKLK